MAGPGSHLDKASAGAIAAGQPWVALGLQALGTFFQVLGREDAPRDLIDPDIKAQFERVKRFRQGQQDVMRGAVTGVIDVSDIKTGGPAGVIERGDARFQIARGRESAGGNRQEAIDERVGRREERLATGPKQDFSDTREMIAKKRREG